MKILDKYNGCRYINYIVNRYSGNRNN